MKKIAFAIAVLTSLCAAPAFSDDNGHDCVSEDTSNIGVISLDALKEQVATDPHRNGSLHACVLISLREQRQQGLQRMNDIYNNVELSLWDRQDNEIKLKCRMLTIKSRDLDANGNNVRRLHIDFPRPFDFDADIVFGREKIYSEGLLASRCRALIL